MVLVIGLPRGNLSRILNLDLYGDLVFSLLCYCYGLYCGRGSELGWLLVKLVSYLSFQPHILFSSQPHNLRIFQWELQEGVPSFEACGKWMSEYTVFFYCVSIKEARQNILWVNFIAWNVWSSPATQLYQIIISFSLFELRILEFPINMKHIPDVNKA